MFLSLFFFANITEDSARSCCSKCNRSASDRLALAATLSALPVAGHACAKWPSWGVAASLMNCPCVKFCLQQPVFLNIVRICQNQFSLTYQGHSGTTWDDTKLTTLLEEQANAMVAHHAFGPGAKSERNTSGLKQPLCQPQVS